MQIIPYQLCRAMQATRTAASRLPRSCPPRQMRLTTWTRPTRWQAVLMCMLCVVWLTGQVSAGDARIVRDSGPDDIVIEMDHATTEQILGVLATRFGFGVDHAAQANTGIRFSGRVQGSLDHILDRVLRHEGHLIVRSAEASAGISQVILFAPQRTTQAVTTRAPADDTKLTDGSASRDELAGRPVAASPVSPAQSPSPSAVTPPAAPGQPIVDPTLRQLQEIGRQIMNVDTSQSVDARPSLADGATASLPANNVGDAQELTQRAVANVQSLVGSLRAICLDRSCAGH